MRLTFKNDIGSIAMGGGDHTSVNIIEIIGLGLPGKEFSNVTYAGQPGHTTTNVRDIARTITLSGTFEGDKREILKMYNILYSPGILVYQNKGIKRQIACYLTNNDEFKQQGNSEIYTFALQFSADDPYFTDTDDTRLSVFTQQPAAELTNKGNISVYPIITLNTSDLSEFESPNSAFTITKSDGSNAVIVLDYVFKSYDTVSFDIPGRKIISAIDGDITHTVSDDTVLSEFYLAPGNNVLEITDSSYIGCLAAEISFRNKYAAIAV